MIDLGRNAAANRADRHGPDRVNSAKIQQLSTIRDTVHAQPELGLHKQSFPAIEEGDFPHGCRFGDFLE